MKTIYLVILTFSLSLASAQEVPIFGNADIFGAAYVRDSLLVDSSITAPGLGGTGTGLIISAGGRITKTSYAVIADTSLWNVNTDTLRPKIDSLLILLQDFVVTGSTIKFPGITGSGTYINVAADGSLTKTTAASLADTSLWLQSGTSISPKGTRRIYLDNNVIIGDGTGTDSITASVNSIFLTAGNYDFVVNSDSFLNVFAGNYNAYIGGFAIAEVPTPLIVAGFTDFDGSFNAWLTNDTTSLTAASLGGITFSAPTGTVASLSDSMFIRTTGTMLLNGNTNLNLNSLVDVIVSATNTFSAVADTFVIQTPSLFGVSVVGRNATLFAGSSDGTLDLGNFNVIDTTSVQMEHILLGRADNSNFTTNVVAVSDVGMAFNIKQITGSVPGSNPYSFTMDTTGAMHYPPINATRASAITPTNGDMVYVSSTNGTFTSIGFWGYQNGVWVKM